MKVKILDVLAKGGLKLNRNQTRQFTELIEDISHRDNLSYAKVLANPQLKTIFENNNLSGPDKIKKLANKLIEMRYPAYSKAISTFKAEIKKLKLHPKIKITPSPFFEDSKINIEFSYNNTNEFIDIIESLKKLSEVDVVKIALKSAEDNN